MQCKEVDWKKTQQECGAKKIELVSVQHPREALKANKSTNEAESSTYLILPMPSNHPLQIRRQRILQDQTTQTDAHNNAQAAPQNKRTRHNSLILLATRRQHRQTRSRETQSLSHTRRHEEQRRKPRRYIVPHNRQTHRADKHAQRPSHDEPLHAPCGCHDEASRHAADGECD
jgi:hypothetical protein